MTRASMEETNAAKPKSPPPPSSGGPPASAPPVSHDRSPSERAMKPSTLMPRNTDPVKERPMPRTLPVGSDDRRQDDPRAPEEGEALVLAGHSDVREVL